MARIVDPDLVARLVRQLNVQGPLAPFDISQIAVPVFDIGKLAALDVPTRVGTSGGQSYVTSSQPFHEPTDVTDDGVVAAPAGGVILADSGGLAAGVHLISASYNSVSTGSDATLEWRNAANAGTIASWTGTTGPAGTEFLVGPFALNLAANERLRWLNINAVVSRVTSWITHPLIAASIA